MAPHDLIAFGSRDWWLTVTPTVAIGALLLVLPRHYPFFKGRAFARAFAAILLANSAAGIVLPALSGTYTYADYLPLHLCGITALMAPAALLFPGQTLGELLYFWGVAGGLQSLLTPEFTVGRAGFLETQYFIQHGSVVLVPIFLIANGQFRPRPRSWLTAFLWIQGLALVVGAFDGLAGCNYMYLCRAPVVESPLVIGAWPWYILGFEVAALAHFYVLGWPFRRPRAVNTTEPPAAGTA